LFGLLLLKEKDKRMRVDEEQRLFNEEKSHPNPLHPAQAGERKQRTKTDEVKFFY
jgi:hypothetical protein